MSGIMTAVAGGGGGIIYGAGLYGPSGVDPVPIQSNGNSPTTFNRTWIGYYVPAATASTNFQVTSTWSSTYSDGNQASIAYLWLGSLAKSGYTVFNANVASNDNTTSVNISVVAGQYYPIRYQWYANLTSGFDPFFFQPYTTSGAFSMRIAGSTTPALFYNRVTNGF
jgi:hypothetical protein